MSAGEWRRRWDAERWFIKADGEAGKRLGNDSIRWHPGERRLEVNLPGPLAHLANAPRGRYRLSCQVDFPYRGGQVAAQAETGAVAYTITFDPAKNRWDPADAQRWLAFLAHHFQQGSGEGELAWWKLRSAAPGCVA